MIKYFILSGIRNTGKTTCLLKVYEYLKAQGYSPIAEVSEKDDIISLLDKNDKCQILFNTASDDPDALTRLKDFIDLHIQNFSIEMDLIVITSLREWNTGPVNCDIRIKFEELLKMTDRTNRRVTRDINQLVDIITSKIDTDARYIDYVKTSYHQGIIDTSISILVDPNLMFKV